jgi:hypothetical protein
MNGCASVIIRSTRLLISRYLQKVFILFLPALLEELAIMPRLVMNVPSRNR